MEAHRIRQAYLEMLVENGHTIIPRTPLVLRDDPTTLFTGSGMQPLLRYLLGEPHPAGTRIGDVQPCLRAQDINDVGDNRHTTFFEMLGNWSLGDYSKSVQIPMLMPATGRFIGTPASSNANVPPQTLAIEVEPFDSMISLVTRTAYGYSASGNIGSMERSASAP